MSDTYKLKSGREVILGSGAALSAVEHEEILALQASPVSPVSAESEPAQPAQPEEPAHE